MALGRLRDPGARAVLEERLRDEPETHTRLALLQGLGLLGDPAALPTVLSLFSTTTEPLLRQGAARTMGMLGDHRATAPLVAALHEPSVSPDLRQAIAIALGQLRDPSAIPALAGLLDDPDPVTVVLGIRGLGEMERSEAATPLLALGVESQTIGPSAVGLSTTSRHRRCCAQREHSLRTSGEPRAWPLLNRRSSPGSSDLVEAAPPDQGMNWPRPWPWCICGCLRVRRGWAASRTAIPKCGRAGPRDAGGYDSGPPTPHLQSPS